MKIFIVGRHASGKLEVLNNLEELGKKVGREFCTGDSINPSMYIDPNFEKLSEEDVVQMFENNAYLYMSNTDESGVVNALNVTRGITQYAFDNADVLMLQPAQLIGINHSCLRKESIIIVWLDNTLSQRIDRHAAEGRSYPFNEIEESEKDYDQEFVNSIYDISGSNILYFFNEDPMRVATIVSVLLDHPEYTELFLNTFK